MKTLAQFKSENNVNVIHLLQGQGRKYASVRDLQLVVSSKTDLGKPLFVTELNERIDPTVEYSEANSRRVTNGYLLVNSGVVVTDEI